MKANTSRTSTKLQDLSDRVWARPELPQIWTAWRKILFWTNQTEARILEGSKTNPPRGSRSFYELSHEVITRRTRSQIVIHPIARGRAEKKRIRKVNLRTIILTENQENCPATKTLKNSVSNWSNNLQTWITLRRFVKLCSHPLKLPENPNLTTRAQKTPFIGKMKASIRRRSTENWGIEKSMPQCSTVTGQKIANRQLRSYYSWPKTKRNW